MYRIEYNRNKTKKGVEGGGGGAEKGGNIKDYIHTKITSLPANNYPNTN